MTGTIVSCARRLTSAPLADAFRHKRRRTGQCRPWRSGRRPIGRSALDGKFWRIENLYAAGLPVLGAATACNPTLTCVAYGLRTADAIKNKGSVQ